MSAYRDNDNNIGNRLCMLINVMILFTLVACSSDSVVIEEPEPRPTSPPELNEATSFSGPLVKAGQSNVSRFLKNGVYSATNRYSMDQRLETAVPTLPSEADASGAGFSETNTQEQGVDEADRIKYNGDTLYLSAHAEWIGEEQVPARIRVMERQSDFSLAESSVLAIESEYGHISGIYEHNDTLAVLSNNAQMYTLELFAPEPWFVHDNKLSIDVYETSVSAAPVVKSKIKIDGTMLSSRRIGQALYLVNSYTVSVDGLNPSAETEKEQLDNYLTILDTPTSDLMPKIYFDDGAGVPLNQASDCMIPQQATDKDGYAHLLSVIRINLSDLTDYSSTCISAVAEVMYMSKDNLYLASSFDNQTVLHKVGLDNDLNYQASGSVSGVIGWRSAPNLRLSEHNGALRIVSSDYTSGEPVHQLFVLQQDGNELKIVGQLPNEQQPQAIGKPGEDIYAVRFFADRGYIVTFERIDPLYVIDLATPTEPSILGELEIPGFSNYLHPLDNGYLLGVGQQVNPRAIPENGDALTVPVIQEGMKVSLFDITNPSQPIEVNSLIKSDSYTPVEYDYRALTVLNTDGFYQFAMPIESWGSSTQNDRRVWHSQSSLALLEVDTRAEKPELIQRGAIFPTNEPELYIYGGEDRSVIHGNQIYYIHGNQVWRSTWEEDGDVFGPY